LKVFIEKKSFGVVEKQQLIREMGICKHPFWAAIIEERLILNTVLLADDPASNPVFR
jgi:hypothetical protein